MRGDASAKNKGESYICRSCSIGIDWSFFLDCIICIYRNIYISFGNCNQISMTAFQHQAGTAMECLSVSVELRGAYF